jgi:hypothetical protein
MNIVNACLLSLFSLAVPLSHAALTPIGPLDFDPNATIIEFGGLSDGTDANGLLVDGVLFEVTTGGATTNGKVVVDGGPGTTNNITPPNLVSLGDISDVAVVVSLPGLTTQFGYGYAILATQPVASATTIELFAGQTAIGQIAFEGKPDPTFTGGFAGLSSNMPFDRAVLTFSNFGEAFAIDNVTFATANNALPEEGLALTLLSLALLPLLCCRSVVQTVGCRYLDCELEALR